MSKNNRMLLFIFGLLPFIFAIINGIRSSIVGFGLSSSHGFQGFLEAFGFTSMFIGILYVPGFFFILKSIKPQISTKKLVLIGAIILGVIVAIIFVTTFIITMLNINDISQQVT